MGTPRIEIEFVPIWGLTYTLRCTHERVYQNNGSSTFKEGDVGPSNVVPEFIKRVKTKGAMRGK